MKHYGDVSKISGLQIEPVDIITFGAPCQDLSVAGKRSGMKHEVLGDNETTRSGLFFEAIRIIKEMRKATNGEYPKYAVYENVPGAFSSNKGHDFHAVLEALCSVCDDTVSIPKPYDIKRTKLVWNKAGEIVGDNYSVAWRTLDAQYWGVPQRRKRIYLVADFTGRRAGEILFKPEGLRGDLSQSNEAGQEVAADAVGSIDGSVGVECLNPWDYQSKRIYNPDGIYCTLPAMDCGGANNQAVIFSFDSISSNSMKSSNPFSGCRAVEIAKCIDTTYPDPSKNQGGIAVVQPVIALQANGIDRAYGIDHVITTGGNCTAQGSCVYEHTQATLKAGGVHAVCYPLNEQIILRHGALGKNTGFGAGEDGDPAYTLLANHPHAVCYDARENGDGNLSPTITGDHQNRITDYTAVAVFEPKSALEENWGEANVKNALRAGASKSSHAVVQETLCFDETQITSPTNGNNPQWNEPSHPLASTARPPTVICKKPPRKYIIRRLTPTECARLQGFPDFWGQLAPYNPADAEFWEEVRKTHAEINDKVYKPVKDIKKWYDKLHTDSAEYKAYGNGLALPCAEFVIRGIAEVLRNEKGQFASKGGVIEHKGYTCIYKPEHPRAKTNGYVREHILVAEEMLGRPLDGEEVVHHINGDKADNRPENLEIFPTHAEHVRHHNRTDGKKYSYNGGEFTVAELSEFSVVDYSVLTQRINKLGWDIKRAVETPKRGQPTLGSLFDGIGGFPLAGVLNGIKPLWASEVEPYPIAVTKSRFKEAHNG